MVFSDLDILTKRQGLSRCIQKQETPYSVFKAIRLKVNRWERYACKQKALGDSSPTVLSDKTDFKNIARDKDGQLLMVKGYFHQLILHLRPLPLKEVNY